MAEKKIDDVKRADKVTPPASSRPIIVTNRPVLTSDPMVTPAQDEKPAGAAVPIVRTAKTISPVTEDLQAPTPEPAAEAAAVTPEEPAEKTPESAAEAAPEPLVADKPEPEQAEPVERDSEAAISAAQTEAEAARQARQAELEQLVASGKYAVPINAIGRKRSQLHVVFFCVLAIILAVVLADVLFDTGLVHAPSSIPHTHFFTAT